jgi:phospholipid/cholesterol/gamma-HCH transport system substrate-binding protein
MKKDFSSQAKVGLFVFVALAILAYVTLEVSNRTLTAGATTIIYTELDNAEGITKKTPVQVAGIPIGAVESIELLDGRRARLGLKVRRGVALTKNMEVQVRARGVLGDTYIELIPGPVGDNPINYGDTLTRTLRPLDYQDLIQSSTVVARDLREITAAMKQYTVSDQSSVAVILKNMETITSNMANFSQQNMENMKAIVNNLAALSQELRKISETSGVNLEASLARIANITEKIENGEGTLGKLLTDEETYDKTQKILDDIGTLTDPIGRLSASIDYHLEYLGNSNNYKNAFDIRLRTHPDKYFLFGVVYNPEAPPNTSTQTEVFTTGGTTTTVQTETSSVNKVRFNAQLAKSFWDVTIRGGLFENTGGVAVDYSKGPMTVSLQGFNFGNPGQNLRAAANLNVTQSLYLTGGGYFLGGTDRVSGQHFGNEWFLGAGLRFTDEDISSLLGGAGLFVP